MSALHDVYRIEKQRHLRDCLEANNDALEQAEAERDRLNREIETMRQNSIGYQKQIRELSEESK